MNRCIYVLTLVATINLFPIANSAEAEVNMTKERLFTDQLVAAANANEAFYLSKEKLESSSFDFLVGRYEIVVKNHDLESGEVLSERVALMNSYYQEKGRMLVNEWTGFLPKDHTKVQFGMNLRTYVADEDRWNTVWLASGQSAPGVAFSFVDEGDQIAARFSYEYPDVGTVDTVLRFYHIAEDAFDWDHQVSLDGGQSWNVLQSHTAKRAE